MNQTNQASRKGHSLAVNATLNTIKTIAGMLLSLITFPYVTRVLGANAIGSYNFSYSIVSYALLISTLGTMSYAIREGAKYRDNAEKMTQFASEVFSISVFSTVIAYVFLFALVMFAPALAHYRLMISILSLEIVCGTMGVNWLGNIYEDFLYITIRTLAFQVLYIIALFIFVKTPEDIYKYAVITTFTASGANVLNYFYLRKKYIKFHFTTKIDWKMHLKPILVIFSTKIAITIYVNSDKTILGLLMNDLEVGLYSTSVKIYSIVKEVLVAMVTVLIPRFSIVLENRDKEQLNLFFSKVFATLSLLLVPATIGLFIMSPEIIYAIAGEEFLRSAASLRILSVATLFSLYANIFTTCILVPARKENMVFYATLVSAAVNVGLNFVLIPTMGLNGAAVTTVIAEGITLVLAIWASRDLVRLKNIERSMGSILLSCLMILCSCLLSKRLINNVFVRLIIAVIFSGVTYFATLFLIKNPICTEFISSIRNKRRYRKHE